MKDDFKIEDFTRLHKDINAAKDLFSARKVLKVFNVDITASHKKKKQSKKKTSAAALSGRGKRKRKARNK